MSEKKQAPLPMPSKMQPVAPVGGTCAVQRGDGRAEFVDSIRLEEPTGEPALEKPDTLGVWGSEYVEVKKNEQGCNRGTLPNGGLFAPENRMAYYGFCAQYFVVGVLMQGIPATTYGVFLGYLNVPSYVYTSARIIIMLPWSFKIFFGLLNDTLPIAGQRRKPYMVIGWALCALALVALGLMKLPEPYWCVNPVSGDYIRTENSEPCNQYASEQGGPYAMVMMIATLGYLIADVAADGLTAQYARCEPIQSRGKTQTTAYFTRTVGTVLSSAFVGVFMNGKLYNGDFSWSLSFNTVCFCLAGVAAVMVPISALLVYDPPQSEEKVHTCNSYMKLCWKLLRSRACFFVVLFCMSNVMIGGIQTTAGPMVKQSWAGVKNFQNQMFTLLGNVLFAGGLWLVRQYFLNVSWWVILGTTQMVLVLLDSIFTICTIFDIVRDQYFYLGETVLQELPLAANFVVSTFVIVEMADDGNEGLVYGLLTTAANLGSPFANAIANQVFGLFTPSLSDHENYIKDEPSFQRTVFYSFLLSYGFAFTSLLALLFLPKQKEEAQLWKRTWSSRTRYGVMTLMLLSGAMCYSLLVNFLSMFPSTMCLRFAGGNGCDA